MNRMLLSLAALGVTVAAPALAKGGTPAGGENAAAGAREKAAHRTVSAAPGPITVDVPAFTGRSAFVAQIGSANDAVITQRAGRARADVTQRGDRNGANVVQRGGLNHARVDQTGDEHDARVVQAGRGRSSLVVAQLGGGNTAAVSQTSQGALYNAAPQISDRSGATAGPVPQISTAQAADDRVPQVTRERGGAAAGAQVSRAPRTAREPEPLSRPSEGRTGAIARVEGEDRCAGDQAAGRPDLCDRVIETRSAEFNRPTAPVLSPEQRLLVDQRLREAGLAARVTATGRVDADEVDPDRLEGQAIASVVLDQPADERKGGVPAANPRALPPASEALIEAIVQRAGGQPPQ